MGSTAYHIPSLPGGDLEDRRLRDPNGIPLPQSPESLATWLPAVAKALDYVHRQGYVHRDIKPANILFDADGNPYLSDFGIAKVVAESNAALGRTNMTGTGLVLGTPDYMAPELVMGEEFDGRADQYALATTVYELLAGRLPFTGATPAAILVKQTTELVPALGTATNSAPAALSAVLQRALSKSPAERYASCSEFAQAVTTTADTHVPVTTSGTKAPEHGHSAKVRLACPVCQRTLTLSAKQTTKLPSVSATWCSCALPAGGWS